MRRSPQSYEINNTNSSVMNDRDDLMAGGMAVHAATVVVSIEEHVSFVGTRSGLFVSTLIQT